jgi:N-methylhydantoinase A
MARSGLDTQGRGGPMVIEEYEGTVIVPPDATAARDADGNILIDIQVDK